MEADKLIETLVTERRQSKKKQSVLCKEIEVSEVTMSHYKQGKTYPKLDTLVKWCNALGFEIRLLKKLP
jgi:transcriptional regulator with XRE-family HTH domain